MKGRPAPLLGAVLACAALVAAVILGFVNLHRAAEHRLDEALGQRLLAVAVALASSADPDSVEVLVYAAGDAGGSAADADPPPPVSTWADSLQRDWRAIARRSDLAEITLTTPEGVVLATTAPNLLRGERSDFWSLDAVAVDSVRAAAQPVSVPTRRVGPVYQASAHAPVVRDDPVVGPPFVQAVLTVRGNPDFYDALDALKRGAAVTIAAVLVVLALAGTVLYRLDVSVRRYRASLAHQENLAAMGRMTAGIAHEIRNPLGIIRGAGQHLERVLADAGIADEFARFIPEEVDRLDRILSGYLAFGRDAEPEAEDFDPEVVVRRSIALVAEELARSGVTVERRGGGLDARLRGDPRRLQQVLLNLLLNARDAMPAGGTVVVDLARAGDDLRVAVSDEGSGLAASPQQCFEPFWTSKEKGGGLGLSVSRRIAESFGGALTLADRTDGRGAVATLRLPVRTAADDPAGRPARKE
jgi:signal transduction histidine kinase